MTADSPETESFDRGELLVEAYSIAHKKYPHFIEMMDKKRAFFICLFGDDLLNTEEFIRLHAGIGNVFMWQFSFQHETAGLVETVFFYGDIPETLSA